MTTTASSTTASAAALLHQFTVHLCLANVCCLPSAPPPPPPLCSARIDYFGLLNQPQQQQRQRQQQNKKKTNDDGSGRGSGADSDSHLQFLNCWLILLPSPCCNCNDKFVFSVLFWSLDSRAPLPISRSLSSLSLPLSLHVTLCWVAACAASALLCSAFWTISASVVAAVASARRL